MLQRILTRGVEEIIDKDSLEKKLSSGKKLKVKLGVDPSSPDLHLGHTVVLNLLKRFQTLGHEIIFLIGDATGLVGDPTGRNKTRPMLAEEQIKENARTYFNQVGKVLDVKKVTIRYNSEWYGRIAFKQLVDLASSFTILQILERDDFAKRFNQHQDIGFHELLYPALQAYDSVMLKADVEIGGTDQKFNLLAGRALQRKLGEPVQDIITCKLLVGTDGSEKMSKSKGNYIGVTEKPFEMFGKIMSIPDQLILGYFKLLTEVDLETVEKDLKSGVNPRDVKVRLAWEILTIYYSRPQAQAAEEEFNSVFRAGEPPSEIPQIALPEEPIPLLELLLETKLAKSKSEGRRLIEQGGVRIDGEPRGEIEEKIKPKEGMIVQVGKRKFVRIK